MKLVQDHWREHVESGGDPGHPITPAHIGRIAEEVVRGCQFRFENEVYALTQGIAMGSRASVSIANVVAGRILERWRLRFPDLARHVRGLYRFIDDLICWCPPSLQVSSQELCRTINCVSEELMTGLEMIVVEEDLPPRVGVFLDVMVSPGAHTWNSYGG